MQKRFFLFSYYVKHTAVSFDYEVPSLLEFTEKMRDIKKRYPYLVVEEDGEVRGYAYAAVFKERVAYDWSVETTIYLNPDYKGRGYGKALYEKLEELLKKQNIQNMNACIACIDVEDEYLTNDSPRFHHHMGFQMVGKFHKSGCKIRKMVRYDMDGKDNGIIENPRFQSVLLQKSECYKKIVIPSVHVDGYELAGF